MVAVGPGGATAGVPRRLLRLARGRHRPARPAARRPVAARRPRRHRHRSGDPPGRVVHALAGGLVHAVVRAGRTSRRGALRPVPIRRQTVPVGGVARAVRPAHDRRRGRAARGLRARRGRGRRSLRHHLGDPDRPRLLQLRRGGPHGGRGVVDARSAGRGRRPDARGLARADVPRGDPARASGRRSRRRRRSSSCSPSRRSAWCSSSGASANGRSRWRSTTRPPASSTSTSPPASR